MNKKKSIFMVQQNILYPKKVWGPINISENVSVHKNVWSVKFVILKKNVHSKNNLDIELPGQKDLNTLGENDWSKSAAEYI